MAEEQTEQIKENEPQGIHCHEDGILYGECFRCAMRFNNGPPPCPLSDNECGVRIVLAGER